jgi:hypothetical protein
MVHGIRIHNQFFCHGRSIECVEADEDGETNNDVSDQSLNWISELQYKVNFGFAAKTQWRKGRKVG